MTWIVALKPITAFHPLTSAALKVVGTLELSTRGGGKQARLRVIQTTTCGWEGKMRINSGGLGAFRVRPHLDLPIEAEQD